MLLGLDRSKQKVKLLGGMRDPHEDAPGQTACREFDEASGKQLGKDSISALRAHLESGRATAMWFRGGKYVLYLVNTDRVSSLRTDSRSLPERYGMFLSSARGAMAHHTLKEMAQLCWIKIDELRHPKPFGGRLANLEAKLMASMTFAKWISTVGRL